MLKKSVGELEGKVALVISTTVSRIISRPAAMTTRAAGLPLEQGAGKPEVHRGDGRGPMAFRPHRERPAA